MVYVNYISTKPGAGSGLWVVVSPDRNTADTLFRILQANRGQPLKVPKTDEDGAASTLTAQRIDRLSPKFWAVDLQEGQGSIASLAAATSSNDSDSAFGPIAGKIVVYRMGDCPSPGLIPLPAVCDIDHDFISGYSFFIRRRGYPNTYWYCCGNLICLSTTKRSRFIISIADAKEDQKLPAAKTPMLDQDHVNIEWIDRGASRIIGLEDSEWLSVKARSPKSFRFSDFRGRFYLGNEGTFDHPDPARIGTTLDVVCWSSPGVFQDTFELCYGIAPRDE
ncbi:hypothetical protein BJX61DRAFT_209430 [Aspergillus egyptiacus]|nr:hypothetical protein BJX61DRAFT_209430 [Aspergillus egyptiacus]